MQCCRLVARSAPAGRTRHLPCEDLHRHRHDDAFAAVVLAGGYVEAGDTGRHRVEAGDVVLHRAFEHHLDRFDARGAEVLVLPLARAWEGPARGRVADPEALARCAERDGAEAVRRLMETLTGTTAAPIDWPDLLARDLRGDPSLSLGDWARARGLHLASLSRGFRQVYGVTPQGFRLAQRTLRAIEALGRSREPLGAVAHDCGFADQAHMTRAVARLTGVTPSALRRAMTG